MRSKKMIGLFASAALALALLLSLMIPLASAPIEADAPAGASEPAEFELDDIWIYDVDSNPTKISVEDAADAYEGDLYPCVVVAYRAAQAAIAELWDLEEEYPTQGELILTYHHPGECQKDSFEYILTAEVCTFELPSGTSAQNLTMANYVYTFTRADIGDEIELQLNEGVVPEGYFNIGYKVKGYDEGWHDEEPTEAEKEEYASKWSEFRDNLLTMEAWELFDGIDEEEDEFPTAGMTFTGILAFLLLLGGVYSVSGRVRKK